MKEWDEKNYWENATRIGEIKRSSFHPVVKFFSNQRFEYIKNFVNFNSIKDALDVGCGTGFSAICFPSPIQVTGIDFSYRNLINNPIKNKIQGSAYHLPFSSNSFDLVYGWDFLHHLENPQESINEMARVAKKYVILFEPNANNPIQYIYGLTNKNERGTLGFNKKTMLSFLNEIKFKLIACDTVGWIFAGASPTFSLKIFKHLPFIHPLGISVVLICKKFS